MYKRQVYSTVSLLIGPAYALAGRVGIAVLLAAFHLAAVAVFAYGLRAALPDAPQMCIRDSSSGVRSR